MNGKNERNDLYDFSHFALCTEIGFSCSEGMRRTALTRGTARPLLACVIVEIKIFECSFQTSRLILGLCKIRPDYTAQMTGQREEI